MKRKVTDLKPNEAILISNDDERVAILLLMDISNFKWNSGDAPFDRNIRTPYPYCLAYKFRSIDFIPSDGIRVVNKNSFYEAEMIYPATDFIVSEFSGNGLTVSEPDNTISIEPSENVLLSEIRNKLTPIKNLIAMLESGFIAPSGSQELIYKELEQCKVNIEELTRNTPTNEQR
jgi:hypothetical protein